jgi:hypothetical protein
MPTLALKTTTPGEVLIHDLSQGSDKNDVPPATELRVPWRQTGKCVNRSTMSRFVAGVGGAGGDGSFWYIKGAKRHIFAMKLL